MLKDMAENPQQQQGEGVHFDPGVMQMFQMFTVYMQQQQAAERGQISTTKALQSIVKKVDQFDGKDITKYLRNYTKEMELNRVTEEDMVRSFELVCVPEIRERIRAIQTVHRNWEEFKLALKNDYFMEDSERVTKRTFLEWVTKPKIGISAPRSCLESLRSDMPSCQG